MKKLIFLAVLMMVLTSCYKDNATFTVEITGTQPTYVVTYTDVHGVLQENKTVENGFSFSKEFESDWKLKLTVVGSGIKVNVYKRTVLIKTFEGEGTLVVNEMISH